MLYSCVALSTYAVPRFTKDLDFVVHLKPGDAVLLAEHFKEGYYCDEDAVKEASGIKVCLILLTTEAIIKQTL